MSNNKFDYVQWAVFGAVVGVVNFILLYVISWVWQLDMFVFAKAATVGRLPISWVASSLQNFFVFEIIFWSITVLIGKFILNLAESNIKNEFWRLFAPLLVGRILVSVFIYMSVDPMLYILQFIQVGIFVYFAALVYDLFNRGYPA